MRARGQATVEMALGLLVFVTVFIFGVHFAEVGFLSIQVQEAASTALWESTNIRMHELPGNFNQLENHISSGTAGSRATQRYADFDGRTSQNGGAATITQVFTRARNLRVTCGATGALSFGPGLTTSASYKNVGGMQCSGEAELRGYEIPRRFMEGPEGFFKEEHYDTNIVIKACAAGRAAGGNCERGQLGILLDDWGLASRQESGECKVIGACPNNAYKSMVSSAFTRHGRAQGIDASRLAMQVVGMTPANENAFHMSFTGVESNFQDREHGGDRDPNDWKTSPGAGSPVTQYDQSFRNRQECFLGKCPR